MMRSAENQLRKMVILMAAAIALLVALSIPSAYLYIQYHHLSSSLQYKAHILADDMSVYIYQYPDSWYYQEDRLGGLLEKNIQLEKEKVYLKGIKFDVHISRGEHERTPLISRYSLLSDGITNVAEVQIQTSLYPVLVNTFYVFYISLVLGLLMFASFYFWPFNILKLTISKLDKVRLKLEEEVEENKALLDKSDDLAHKLISQRDFTDTVLEVAGNVIAVIDINGCFFRFNRAAEELTGFNSDEVIGRPVWDFVIPEDQKEGVQKVFDNLRKGNTKIAAHYENDWLTRDGHRQTLDWRNSVLRNEKGDVTHIVTLGYDISERKATEEHRQRLQRELDQARKMEALGQLTGGIAHDFNNILGIITGYSGLAIDDLDATEQPDMKVYLDNILQSSKRASDLVKQMMVFSRSDPGMSEVLDLEQVVTESVNMLGSVLPSSIRLDFASESHLPNVMMGAVQMQQILMNLCLNARDAMGGVGKLDIKLGWHRDINAECMSCHKQVTGDWLELSVKDTGCGMTEDVVERIFEPFYTTKAVGEGSGMGLSVIHTIVDNHAGHILIDTRIDKGTKFSLLFPPIAEHQETSETELDSEILQDKHPGNGEKLLIVDDEEVLAAYLEGMLTKKGYRCETRTNSRDALSHFKLDPMSYDMVITDQTMPELTGIELINEIRELRPGMPVILATGYSDVINKEQAEEQGIIYIAKPFNSFELIGCIGEGLKGKVD